MIKISKALFDSCEEQTYTKEWYSRGKLASSFRDKHLLLVIHIWMCHRRLVSAYGTGEDVRADRLQECLFDFLWDDSTTRISEAKVSSLFINKYLKQVQSLSFHICHELDTALALPFVQTGPTAEGEAPSLLTEEQMHDAAINKIGEVIWNHFYDSNPDMEEAHVLEFARYCSREEAFYCVCMSCMCAFCIIRINSLYCFLISSPVHLRYILVEQHRVHSLPYEQFISGDMQWTPVPAFQDPIRPGVKAGKGPGRKWKPLITNASSE